MGFFSDLFGKKNCCLCNQEVGATKRTKIRNKETKEYVCYLCARKCSQFVRLSELTKDEVIAHMKFMETREKIFNEVLTPMNGKLYSAGGREMGIRFFDDAGMLVISDPQNHSHKEVHEVIRYDEVASYEYYKEENPGQNGGKPTFKEDGVKLRICYQQGVQVPDFSGKKAAGGTRPHPYIKQEIKLPFRKSEKATNYADNTIQHFDFIFGVHDDEHGLFGGMSKAEKANLKAGAESLKLAGSLLKSAVKGELDPNNIDPELQAKAEEAAKLNEDAKMGSIAKYMRAADEIEAKYAL